MSANNFCYYAYWPKFTKCDKSFLSMLPKDTYPYFGSDFGICVVQNQRTFENQSLIIEVKKISKIKNPNPSLLWIGKILEIYTAQDQHFKIQILNIWMNWERIWSNLSFTVENIMGNLQKKGWSHLKLNINDWFHFQKV